MRLTHADILAALQAEYPSGSGANQPGGVFFVARLKDAALERFLRLVRTLAKQDSSGERAQNLSSGVPPGGVPPPRLRKREETTIHGREAHPAHPGITRHLDWRPRSRDSSLPHSTIRARVSRPVLRPWRAEVSFHDDGTGTGPH